MSAIAAGTASPDVTLAINERRAKVEVLRSRPTVPTFGPEERERHARLMLRAHRTTFEQANHQNVVRDPAAGRQALRALGVELIVVTPDDDGTFAFEGMADLGRLICPPVKKSASPLPPPPPTGHPPRPHSQSIAPAEPALDPSATA